MALFKKLALLDGDDEPEMPECQDRSNGARESESTSTFAPMQHPRGLGKAYLHPDALDDTDAEQTQSETQKSAESFVLPTRGRGMMFKAAVKPPPPAREAASSAIKSSPSPSQEGGQAGSGSTPRMFSLGRGLMTSSGDLKLF